MVREARAKQKDEADEKMPKPKVLFKMNFEVFDNAVIDNTLYERYENEDTGRWKTRTVDTAQEFKQALQSEICEDPVQIGATMLAAIGIDPVAFARAISGSKVPGFVTEDDLDSDTVPDIEDEDEPATFE